MSKEYNNLKKNEYSARTLMAERHPIPLGSLQRRNDARDAKKLEKWSIAEISQALSGEVGELQNKLKKKYTQKEKIPMAAIEEEFADIQIYLCLLASKVGIDLGLSTARKFNTKIKSKKK